MSSVIHVADDTGRHIETFILYLFLNHAISRTLPIVLIEISFSIYQLTNENVFYCYDC